MNLRELRKRPHLSNSQINQLLNVCSLQYYFERVARIPRAFNSASLVFGDCVHRTLKTVFLGLKAGRIPSIERYERMFSRLWELTNRDKEIKFPETEDIQSLDVKGRNMVRCFLEHIDPADKVQAVSEPFCVPVHAPDGSYIELPLIGEFDAVIKRNGQPVIVDWKTAARKWSKGDADKKFQASVYSYAWHQLYSVRPEIRFDVVTKTKVPGYEQHPTYRTEDDERRMALLIARAQQMIRHQVYYPAETGFYCKDCPYASDCKAWHQQPALAKAA
ncbi:MAG: PD-(D/E)XK nuclease family protein [Kiritimatiellales bacterium]